MLVGLETIPLGRAWLEHPLTSAQDSRNVALCEIFAIRIPLLKLRNQEANPEVMDSVIDDIMLQTESWEKHWSDWYGELIVVVYHSRHEMLV